MGELCDDRVNFSIAIILKLCMPETGLPAVLTVSVTHPQNY